MHVLIRGMELEVSTTVRAITSLGKVGPVNSFPVLQYPVSKNRDYRTSVTYRVF